jgi:ADP-ribose pyrophosphatase YjhB (NUDIX family)
MISHLESLGRTDKYKGNVAWFVPLPDGMEVKKFEVAARAFVVHEQKILLVYEEDTDMWWTPGGRIAPDEDLHTACIREVDEETGLSVKLGDLVATWSVTIPRDWGLSRKFEFMFWATLSAPPDFIERTHQDADQSEGPVSIIKWFNAQEAAALPNIFPPFLRQWPDLLTETIGKG